MCFFSFLFGYVATFIHLSTHVIVYYMTDVSRWTSHPSVCHPVQNKLVDKLVGNDFAVFNLQGEKN